jgi:hypothetical protein
VQVVRNAPDTIRMAVGIRTSHTFAIVDLVRVLEQQVCADCGKRCLFIDMSRIQRVCLGVDGCCDKTITPLSLADIQAHIPEMDLSDDDLVSVPSYSRIPGLYSQTRFEQLKPRTEAEEVVTRSMRYDLPAACKLMRETNKRGGSSCPYENVRWPGISYIYPLAKSMSCVLAPWLASNSVDHGWSASCQICTDTQMAMYTTWDKAGVGELRTRTEHDEHMKTHT